MSNKKKMFALCVAAVLLNFPAPSAAKKKDKTPGDKAEITASGNPILWREPDDIASRNLFDGPGGNEHPPHPPFTFVAEDMDGSNPKFDVRDQDGVKWKVKLGAEAKPETAASRLVWSAGYFANEDYFLPLLRVQGMPAHLKRKNADKFIEPDGSMPDVRLKRHVQGEKKMGIWEWRNNPFTGTREFNGLRVVMALINNWDLKDQNNAVYREKRSQLIYMVTDLGASFGTTHLVRGHEKAKGNLQSYKDSKFIRKVDGDFVDFDDPHRPAMVVMANPHEFVSRLNLEWIGRQIPRADAKWMGQLLAILSPSQIRDGFRAAGYTSEEVEGFASVLESRIAELNNL